MVLPSLCRTELRSPIMIELGGGLFGIVNKMRLLIVNKNINLP